MDKHTKTLSNKDLEALRVIRNALVHGRSPSIREIQVALGYKSPRSAHEIVNGLITCGVLRRRSAGGLQLLQDLDASAESSTTLDVPLVGSAPCGAPLLAVENIEAMVSVSVDLARPPHRYFLLRAMGDSMDELGIEDGDLILFRQQSTAEPGDVVVALIDDEATIKEFRPTSQSVMLQPRSSNLVHKSILVTGEFRVQGVAVGMKNN